MENIYKFFKCYFNTYLHLQSLGVYQLSRMSPYKAMIVDYKSRQDTNFAIFGIANTPVWRGSVKVISDEG